MTKVIIEHDMHVVFSLADRDHRAGAGPDHRRRRARRGAGRPAGAGSLSRRSAPANERSDHRRTETRAGRRRAAGLSSACRDIHAYYGESYIVQGVSFEVREGEILALLGRNGAGKTSTLRAIARAATPSCSAARSGCAGKPLHRLRSSRRRAGGIQLVPEDRRIIGGLTVEENLTLAADRRRRWAGRSSASTTTSRASPSGASRRAMTLSGGEQQMLAVARALARDLKLLLLDEPYEGLAPVIVARDRDDRRRDQGARASPRSSSSRTPSPRSSSPIAPSSSTWAASSSTAPPARCSTTPSCATSTWRSERGERPLPGTGGCSRASARRPARSGG